MAKTKAAVKTPKTEGKCQMWPQKSTGTQHITPGWGGGVEVPDQNDHRSFSFVTQYIYTYTTLFFLQETPLNPLFPFFKGQTNQPRHLSSQTYLEISTSI